MEQIVQPLLQRKGKPLDRIAAFDIMRMFYVALSRAKNLLVVAHYKGQGQRINSPFNEVVRQRHHENPRVLGREYSEGRAGRK